MDLADVLNSLSDTPATEKVAADNSNDLSAALDAALAEQSELTKVASHEPSTPTQDLTKIAEQLANAEQEALLKEAELYGAAVCDGFISRMGDYEGQGVKVASFGAEGGFDKFASENPELVKQAMELGYRETKDNLEKIASAAVEQGYAETMEHIKVAAEKYAEAGYNDALKVLSSLQG